VLSVVLEARESALRLSGPGRPPVTIAAFSEPGKAPLMPGPLIRAPQGTELRLTVHNTLRTPLTFVVPAELHDRHEQSGAVDSIVVPAGDVRTLTTIATVPGNYVYHAMPPAGASRKVRVDGLLAGAIVIDTAAARAPPQDRVFVIMATLDSAFSAYVDTTHVPIPLAPPGVGRVLFTINGLSWPNTERIHATVGDSLHWRVINASAASHPMHLHGFYYRVDEFSGPLADYQGRPVPGERVVTQLMSAFSGMSMTWSPDRPGNWLFHCHFAQHLQPDSISAGTDDPQMRGMVGLVLGVEIAERPGITPPEEPKAARYLRLVAIVDSSGNHGGPTDPLPSMRFVLEEHGRRVDTGRDFSPEIDLTRGEPVSIMIVNHLDEPTSVHWHGIEVEDSYVDGVPGFSGAGGHLAPAIAPGDSFEARFTPPRSGTFMYHAHMDDVREQTAGLEGALIVRDRSAAPSPDDHVIFFKGQQRFNRAHPLEINGQASPDTMVLHVGRVARLRILNLSTQSPTPTFSLTAPGAGMRSTSSDTTVLLWRPVAKDGATLPSAAQTPRAARQMISMGETYDFEFVPRQAGSLRLDVRATPPPGIRPRSPGLLIAVPIRVE